MAKRIYKAVAVKRLDVAELQRALAGEEKVVFGCDAAKEHWRGALMLGDGRVVRIVSWAMKDSMQVVELLRAVQAGGTRVEVAAEPTGTYADAFAHQVRRAGLRMYSISAKHSHDYQEIYDGVPSGHDSKSAAVVAKLHWERNKASEWPRPDACQRDLRALCDDLNWVKSDYQRSLSRLESRLARHWPEVMQELELDSATLQMLVADFGDPAIMAKQVQTARARMQKVSRGKLSATKLESVLSSAGSTLGMPMTAQEVQTLKALAKRLQGQANTVRQAEQAVRQASQSMAPVQAMAACLGPVTAAVIVAYLGDPGGYANSRSLLKQAGLNLKERSSGQHKGQLRITKRGNSTVRRWLFMAALRLIQTDPNCRAWVNNKAVVVGARQLKLKAVIALMRKLLTALRHVAKGEPFDSSKLFDVRRLQRLGSLPCARSTSSA